MTTELAFGMLSGALAAGFLVVVLFFAKFFARTRDPLFAFFAAAFLLLAVERLTLIISFDGAGEPTWLYLVRLAAFVVLACGIWNKNRSV